MAIRRNVTLGLNFVFVGAQCWQWIKCATEVHRIKIRTDYVGEERVCCTPKMVGCRALKTTVAAWIVAAHCNRQALVIPRETRLDINRSGALWRDVLPDEVELAPRAMSWKPLHICELRTANGRLWLSNKRHFDVTFLIIMKPSRYTAKADFWCICQEEMKTKNSKKIVCLFWPVLIACHWQNFSLRASVISLWSDQ